MPQSSQDQAVVGIGAVDLDIKGNASMYVNVEGNVTTDGGSHRGGVGHQPGVKALLRRKRRCIETYLPTIGNRGTHNP